MSKTLTTDQVVALASLTDAQDPAGLGEDLYYENVGPAATGGDATDLLFGVATVFGTIGGLGDEGLHPALSASVANIRAALGIEVQA